MSKARWWRCPVSGLTRSQLERLKQIDPSYLDPVTGYFNPNDFAGCDLFNPASIVATAFGHVSNPTRELARLRAEPRFHRYDILSPRGGLITLATFTGSAAAAGLMVMGAARARVAQAQARNLAPFKPGAGFRLVGP
jgi:hypothetical protein